MNQMNKKPTHKNKLDKKRKRRVEPPENPLEYMSVEELLLEK
jgi:hypothetical protein